jgi:hypothetical protein
MIAIRRCFMRWKALFGLLSIISGLGTACGTVWYNWFEETLIGLGLTLLLLIVGLIMPVRVLPEEVYVDKETPGLSADGSLEARLRIMEGRMVKKDSSPLISEVFTWGPGVEAASPGREGPSFF